MTLVIALLAATLPVSAQTVHSFRSEPFTLYYEVFGKGPPLYVFTGGPGEGPGHPYYQIIDSLKSHYTCILLHQRGTGRSRAVPMNKKTVTLASYVQDVEQLRLSRKDQKVTLVGYSWGGLLAMGYAAAHPNSVSDLVLLASAPASYRTWNALYGNQYVRRSREELDSLRMLESIYVSKSFKELDSLKHVYPWGPEVIAYRESIRIHVRAMHYRKDNVYKHFDEQFKNFNFQPIPFIDEEVLSGKMDLTPKLKQLKAPALILYGRQDDQGEAVFFEQRDALPNGQVHVIEECGHEMQDDQPVEFYRILMTYLGVK